MTTTAGTTTGFGSSRVTERSLATGGQRRIASIAFAAATGAAALLFVVPSLSTAQKGAVPTTTPTATTIPVPMRAEDSISQTTMLRDETVHGCEGISLLTFGPCASLASTHQDGR